MNGTLRKNPIRTRLTLAEQVEAARLLKSGTNASVVMCQLAISRQTAIKIKHKCDEIISRAHGNEISLNSKTIREVAFPEIAMSFYNLSIWQEKLNLLSHNLS